MKTTTYKNLTLLELDAEGSLLGADLHVNDVLGEAFGTEATIIVVPVGRIAPAFFELRSGIAGDVFQKMQNYGRRFVVVGDIAAQLAQSKSLRDFVGETNRIGNHLFVPDREALLARL